MSKCIGDVLCLLVGSLVLWSCALPEVSAWIPPAEMPPTQTEVAATADPMASVDPEHDVEPPQSSAGLPAGGTSANVDAPNVAPAAGSSGTGAAAPAMPAGPCVCAAGAPCCDGCNLLADGARCDGPGPAQCVEGTCQAGVCKTMIKPTYCLVSNICYRDGDPAPRYDCMHCVPSRAQDKFSPRPAGTRCDDKVFCNGTDRCDAYGQCSDSVGSPCPADYTCFEVNETCNAPQPSSAQ